MTEETLRERRADLSTLGSGAGVALVGRVAGRVIQVVCEVVLARFLGPATFGLYAAGWALLRLVGLIAPLGLDKGVVRFGAGLVDRSGRMKGLIYESLGVVLGLGIAIGLTFYFAAGWLATAIFHKPELAPVIRGLAPAVAPLVGLRVAAAITRVTCRMHYSVLAEDLASTVTNLVLIGVVYWAGLGLMGAVFACSASFVVAFGLSLIWVGRLYPVTVDRGVAAVPTGRPLFAFSLVTSLAGVSTLVMLWIDRLLLAQLRPAAEVGIYQAATQPAFVFSTILVSFNAVLIPMIAGRAEQGDRTRLAELFRVSTKWGLYLSVPPFLLICFAPEALIEAIFGPLYLPGVPPMLLLSAGQLVNAGTGAVGAILIMTGHQRKWMVATAAFLMLAVILNLYLIPRYGMLGAAAATSCSTALLFVTGLLMVRRVLGLWPYDARYFKGAVAGAAAVAGLFAARAVDWSTPWLSLVVHGVVAGTVFLVVLRLLGLDDEDRELLRLIRARFREVRA